MGFWRFWAARARTRRARGNPSVGDEASAFLRGELLENLLSGGSCRNVPTWVWLNTASHAPADRVAQVAAMAVGPSGSGPVKEWGEARAVIALELLERAGADRAALVRLQRDVLVPLEQDVSAVTGLTPARLVDLAVTGMRLIDS